jgi:hypothetical protein
VTETPLRGWPATLFCPKVVWPPPRVKLSNIYILIWPLGVVGHPQAKQGGWPATLVPLFFFFFWGGGGGLVFFFFLKKKMT